MSRKYKFLDQSKLYFVSFATVHWIDIFTREIYKSILIDILRFCQLNKGLEIFGWCFMTNHVHLIIGIHPYMLHAQMYLRSIGVRPMLFSYYLNH
jgi:REP element-mobilizing transposase RayT